MIADVNGVEWEILECSNSELPLNDGFFLGRTFYFDRKIYLNKDSIEQRKRQTLRHELVHAFLYETQIATQEKDYTYTEEMLCEFVGKYGDKICEIEKKYFEVKK